eukprot:UN17623
MPDALDIKGYFNNNEIYLSSVKTTEVELENQAGFIGRFKTNCKFISSNYQFYSDFYSKKNNHFASSNHTLCNSVISFSSGFDDEEVFKRVLPQNQY